MFSQGTLPGASHLCWVLATAKEFCTAVSYLHSMDVVHGDLKSSNVLLKAAAVTNWDSRGFVAKVCLAAAVVECPKHAAAGSCNQQALACLCAVLFSHDLHRKT